MSSSVLRNSLNKCAKFQCGVSMRYLAVTPTIRTTDEQQLLQHVEGVLRQNVSIISELTDADYQKNHQNFMEASVGSHVRHILDHFACVVAPNYPDEPGKFTEILRYDERKRKTDLETDRHKAVEKCEALIKKLNSLPLQKEVTVEFMSDPVKAVYYTIPSNIGRELNFAAHHGIHHLFTITLMMHDMGYKVSDKSIGVANSTINSIIKEQGPLL